MVTYVGTSATCFGEISPLWQKFKGLWQFVKGLFSIWENFEPTLANSFWNRTNFACCKWPELEKVI